MAIDSSKFFDSIRVKPNKLSAKQQAAAREEAVMCEAPGCKNKGGHRAPKGRGHEKEYWHFCLNHVREYNQGYNFYQGMAPDAVASYSPAWGVVTDTSGLDAGRYTECRSAAGPGRSPIGCDHARSCRR